MCYLFRFFHYCTIWSSFMARRRQVQTIVLEKKNVENKFRTILLSWLFQKKLAVLYCIIRTLFMKEAFIEENRHTLVNLKIQLRALSVFHLLICWSVSLFLHHFIYTIVLFAFFHCLFLTTSITSIFETLFPNFKLICTYIHD